MTNPLDNVALVAKVLAIVDSQPEGVIFSTKEITQQLPGTAANLINESKRVGKALAQLGLLKRRSRQGTCWAKPATWRNRTNEVAIAREETRLALAKKAVEGVQIHSAADLRQLTSTVIPPTIEALFSLAMNPAAKHSDQLAAISMLHDRILGKSVQQLAVEVRDVRSMSTAELERLLAVDAEFTEIPAAE